MKLNELAIIGVAATTVVSCTPAKTEYASYELYPVRSGSLTENIHLLPRNLHCGHLRRMKFA